MKEFFMKAKYILAIVLSIFVFSTCIRRISYRIENKSSVSPLACVLITHYVSDTFVRSGDYYSTGEEQVWFKFDNESDCRKAVGDSVAVVIIDPSLVNVRILNYHRSNGWLTAEESESIRNNPSCVIAIYYLSQRQFMADYGEYKYFPPDEKMKTTVRMWPSYEELVEKYSK